MPLAQALRALVALLLVACGDDSIETIDAGPTEDARVADAKTPVVALDAGGLDASVDAAAVCAEVHDFISSHSRCSSDEDCTIVGSCTGGFGFYAVQTRAAARAQQYSDQGACGPVYDGPTFNAVCSLGECGLVPNGHRCGEPPADGGLSPGTSAAP